MASSQKGKKKTSKTVGKTPTQKVADKIKDLMKQAEEFEKRKPALEKEATEKISYAKTRLMQMEPFFAMLLFKLPTEPVYQIPTMATDGTHLMYNPIFVAEHLLRKDVMIVLLHEIEHIFFKHHIRGPIPGADAQKIFDAYRKQFEKTGTKDVFMEAHLDEIKKKLKKWNKATDYVINYNIKDEIGLTPSEKLQKEWLYDACWKDHTSEKVYEKLKDDDKDQGNGGSDGDMFGIGGVLPAGLGDLSDQEIAQIEKDLEGEVRAAAIAAKKAGKLPAGVENVIDSLYTTTTPWQDIFRTIFTQISKQDYTFRFPNRRYTMHQAEWGVIMPSTWGEEYTDAYFIMDTSGSVGQREKKILVSELRQILEDYPIRLHVIYCDTQAYTNNIETLTREDIQNGKLRLDVKGGGGTDMRPAFKHINDHLGEIDPEVVICMTDMYLGSWDLGPEPEYNVYWAQLPGHDKGANPPWGTKIDIIIEGD